MKGADDMSETITTCLYGSDTCPANDGDMCNHRPYGDSPAWDPPRTFWRPAPCGHPENPVAWVGPLGAVCHCGILLDVGTSTSFIRDHYDGLEEWPLVSCSGCGCLVAVPRGAER